MLPAPESLAGVRQRSCTVASDHQPVQVDPPRPVFAGQSELAGPCGGESISLAHHR
jgi:hypothetical protein